MSICNTLCLTRMDSARSPRGYFYEQKAIRV
uniref:Uncharacterized protein n=1 Tax=Lepeophtheirus salmonis TaxID=72036 RepID=A0A0K2VCN2_LEPSM